MVAVACCSQRPRMRRLPASARDTNFDLTRGSRASSASRTAAMVYSWGYGCNTAPTGFNPPASTMPNAKCPDMQVPGPTLIVHGRTDRSP